MLYKSKNVISLFSTIERSMSGGTTSLIIVEKIGAITTIGINRPERRNCVNQETAQLLKDAIANFENDKNAIAGVLYGTGGNFCSGYDLAELATSGSNVTLSSDSGTMGPTHRFIKKPLIAAVSGYAVAGGLELALMCDLRVVEENAIMGVYCRRFGVPLIDGGTVRLTAMVGLSRALDLILTGRSLSAKEAFDWGIANRVVACGTSLGQAVNMASSLIKFPQDCMLTDRASTYRAAFNLSYEELLKYEREKGACVLNEEAIAGAQKFLSGIGKHGKFYNLKEKEKPSWEISIDADTKSKL